MIIVDCVCVCSAKSKQNPRAAQLTPQRLGTCQALDEQHDGIEAHSTVTLSGVGTLGLKR